MTQQKGFSAIEILIAITVLAILAGGVFLLRQGYGGQGAWQNKQAPLSPQVPPELSLSKGLGASPTIPIKDRTSPPAFTHEPPLPVGTELLSIRRTADYRGSFIAADYAVSTDREENFYHQFFREKLNQNGWQVIGEGVSTVWDTGATKNGTKIRVALDYQNGKLRIEEFLDYSPILTLTTPLTPDSTADWKTYKFSKTILLKVPQTVDPPLYINAGHYAVETSLPGGNRLQLYGADGPSPMGEGRFEFDPSVLVKDKKFMVKDISFGGLVAKEFISDTSQSDMIWGGEIYQHIRGLVVDTLQGPLVIALYLPSDKKGNLSQDNNIFDKILSTFKFLD